MLSWSNIKSFLFISVAGLIVLVSCNKNNENTGSGPKTKLSITHLIVNAPALDVFLDGTKMNSQQFSFGSTIIANSSIYNEISPGIHMLKVSAGNSTYLEKNILLVKDSSYSLFFYDSLLNDRIKAMLIEDIKVPDTSLAKARFFHMVPGDDTLKALFIKDTLQYPVGETYLGKKFSPEGSYPFNISFKPGTYRLDLIKENQSIFSRGAFNAEAGKIYSIIATGAKGGTGVYKESITILQHN